LADIAASQQIKGCAKVFAAVIADYGDVGAEAVKYFLHGDAGLPRRARGADVNKRFFGVSIYSAKSILVNAAVLDVFHIEFNDVPGMIRFEIMPQALFRFTRLPAFGGGFG